MIERVPYGGWPRPTPTNPERVEAWRRKYARIAAQSERARVHPYGSDLIDLTDPNEPDIPCFEGAPGTTYTEEF